MSLLTAVGDPTLFHAWVSCCAAAVSNSRPEWKEEALLHYDHAVNGFSRALRRKSSQSEEWTLATVLLLMIFEEFQLDQDESAACRAHINGAHHLFQLSVKQQNPPESLHGILCLEGYVFRAAVNNLFQPNQNLPFNYVEKLLAYLMSAKTRAGLSSYHFSPWVGISGDLLDIAFKLSWLKQRLPLQGHDLVSAVAISNKLTSWPLSEGTQSTSVQSDDLPLHEIQAAKLYWLACSLLLHKLLYTDATSEDPSIRGFSQQGCTVLTELIETDHISQTVLWPLTVLGTAALGPDERSGFDEILTYCSKRAGFGTVKRIRELFHCAWDDESPSTAMHGAGLLLDVDAMRMMFL